MVGTYLTPTAPVATTTMLMKPETAVLVGTANQYGSLETSSWVYATYGVSIGLSASFQMGILSELTFAHVPAFEAVESYNVTDNSVYEVTGEETTATVGIRQFDYRVIELALGTGTRIMLGAAEAVYPFGGGCTMIQRPYSLEFTNESCSAPSAQDITVGITGGCITLYDCFISSGLEWAMTAKEGSAVTLELTALPILARVRGRRLGCLYIY
jgi:hypothetical protein